MHIVYAKSIGYYLHHASEARSTAANRRVSALPAPAEDHPRGSGFRVLPPSGSPK